MLLASVKPKNISQKCGVYFFRDKRGRILYIGKAISLRNRLRSYFGKSQIGPRLQKMLEVARKIDWQEIDSEIEALLLESQLIKKYRPLFNIMLRDDKQYFFVTFSKDKFPKVIITHRPNVLLGSKIPNPKSQIPNKSQTQSSKPDFIGPFTDGTALKATLKLLRRVFPFCTCKQKHNNYCLNYHLGNCPGFCCLKNPESRFRNYDLRTYKKNIRAVKEILGGKRKSLIKMLEKEMRKKAEGGNLRKAIELRDKIEKLKKVFENARIIQTPSPIDISIYQYSGGRKTGALEELRKLLKLSKIPRRIEGYDISNIQGRFAAGAMAVFIKGRPDKNKFRKFKIRAMGGDTEMLKEILIRRFNHPEWPYPDLIIIDGGKGQLNAARSVIPGHCKFYGLAMSIDSIPVIALTKDAKHRGDHIYMDTKKTAVPLKNLPPEVRNLILQVDAEAHRFAIGYYRKLHRKNI